MKRNLLTVAVLLTIFLLVIPSQSVTIYVRTDGNDTFDGSGWTNAKKTVQAGINAAVSGDEVWVAAGTYVELVTHKSGVGLYGGFSGTDGETVAGRDYKANVTVLDGNKQGSVVTVPKYAVNSTIIDGFTIKNGSSAYGGGINCNQASPIIRSNVISANTATSGGGIFCEGGSPTISSNTITDNSVFRGGGIFCLNSTMVVISNNVIRQNQASYAIGGVACSECSVTISGNTISSNTDTNAFGCGLRCFNLSSPSVISNNIIEGNVSTGTTKLAVLCSGIYTFVNNTIAGNSGTGLLGYALSATIANNIIAFNGSGVSLPNSTAVFKSNCVYENSTTNYVGNDLTGVNGNISIDPQFADRSGGDYHLSVLSRCIDAGFNDVAGIPVLDIDGEGRIFNEMVDIGADEYWPPKIHLATARVVQSSSMISVTGAIVSAAFPDFFYIESEDRSCGIRVDKEGHTFTPGMRISVMGEIGYAPNGEVCITAISVTRNGTGSVAPLALNHAAIGGGMDGSGEVLWSWQWVRKPGQRPVQEFLPIRGLINIGLLIKVYGKVTQVDPNGSYFYINDGSNLKDGTKTEDKDNIGVRIAADGRELSSNQFLTITGISSCFKWTDEKLRRLIRVADPATDIK